MAVADETLGAVFQRHHWRVCRYQTLRPVTGPEALWSVAAPAWMIKHVTAHLEDTHRLGRLWDIDIICPKTGLLKEMPSSSRCADALSVMNLRTRAPARDVIRRPNLRAAWRR